MTRKQSSLFPDSDTSDTLNVLRDLDRAEAEPLAFKIIISNPADATTSGTGPAGAKIFRTLWALKKDGQSEDTLTAKGQRLKYLAKHVDLDDPEAVKGYIANQSNWSNAYKQGVAYAYNSYVETNDLQWTLPHFRIEDRLPKIPTEDRIARANTLNC